MSTLVESQGYRRSGCPARCLGGDLVMVMVPQGRRAVCSQVLPLTHRLTYESP